MFRSSGSDRYQSKPNPHKECCCIQEYEDEISILQQKLMQTHNKLIEQLDVCRQQQLTIIDLTKKIISIEGAQRENQEQSGSFTSSNINADISHNSQESLQKYCFYINPKQAIDFTLNNSQQLLGNSNYNSPTFLQNNRNQLLKTDLQVMRVKLMQEITQKSRLSKELNQFKQIHNQKVAEYKKQVKDLEHDHEYLLKEYQYIKVKIQKQGKYKSGQKAFSSVQLNELNQKCAQYQRLYRKQVTLNQQMNRKLSEYKTMIIQHKQKIKNLQSQMDKYNHCVKSTSTAADGLKDQRDRQQLIGTIRMSRNPGTLWQKDSNKSKVSTNLTDTEIFKKRNTLAEVSYSGKVPIQLQKIQNKQNITQSISKGEKVFSTKQKSSKRGQPQQQNNKQDYQSTKQLIKKLQQAQMMTRQRKRGVIQ